MWGKIWGSSLSGLHACVLRLSLRHPSLTYWHASTSGLPELPHICEVEVMYFIICNLVSICGLCLSQSEAWRLDNLGLQIRTEMPRKEEGGGGVQRTYRVDATGQSWCSISCRSKKEGGCSSMLKAWLNTLLDGLIFFLVFGPQIVSWQLADFFAQFVVILLGFCKGHIL